MGDGTAVLALLIAHPGADHASLATETVALLARDVLRAREVVGLGPAVRPAGIAAVDREGRAGAAETGHDLAVLALALRARAQRRRLGRDVVEGIAERTAFSGRERAGRVRLDDAGEKDR